MPIRLYDEDFERYSNQGQLNRQVLVAQYRVPRSTVLRLSPGLPIAVRIAWRTLIDLPAEAGRTSYTASLGEPFPDPPWLPPDAKVYAAYRVGQAVVAEQVISYDAQAGTVQAAVTDQAGQLQIDVLMPRGALTLAATAATGQAAVREQAVLTIDLMLAHRADQNRRPFSVAAERYLLPDWGLRWYLRAGYLVGMDSPITVLAIDVDQATMDQLQAVLAEHGLTVQQFEQAALQAWG